MTDVDEIALNLILVVIICSIIIGGLLYKINDNTTNIASLEATVIGLQTSMKPLDLVDDIGTDIIKEKK